MKGSPWESLITAILLFLLMVLALRWQQAALHNSTIAAMTESWQHVSQQYPIPGVFTKGPHMPEALLQAVVVANPFSPQRRQIPPVTTASTQTPPIASQAAPLFVYKGRILMGTTQRAILEDVRNKKTYFLQRGQGVAGLTLLDIAENQVVLSDQQTHEEVVVPISLKKASP